MLDDLHILSGERFETRTLFLTASSWCVELEQNIQHLNYIYCRSPSAFNPISEFEKKESLKR